MAFQKFVSSKYPPRLWALVGYPNVGKSTFATQMTRPLLAIDADQRFLEVIHLVGDERVFRLSDRPVDNTDTNRIAALLAANMSGTYIGTIVVDSLSSIVEPIITQTLTDHDLSIAEYERKKAAGEKVTYPNLAAAMRTKALAMRQLQDSVSRWGTDVLWVYHLRDARDEKAQKIVRETLSKTERARLTRSINMELRVFQQGSRHGIEITWARNGRSGITLWDEAGNWAGMPEKIEHAVYDGLSRDDMKRIEQTPPSVTSEDEAIEWGYSQGAFKALDHARNAWEKLARERGPLDLAGMMELWKADIQRRLEGNHDEKTANGKHSQAPETVDIAETQAKSDLIRMIPALIREHRLTSEQANTLQTKGKKDGYVAALAELRKEAGLEE